MHTTRQQHVNKQDIAIIKVVILAFLERGGLEKHIAWETLTPGVRVFKGLGPGDYIL